MRVFVSSSDEVKEHRRFFKAVEDAIRWALRNNDVAADLAIELWEDATAVRTPRDRDGNDRFVQMALDADVTACLLATDIRDGTRGELEAVMEEDEVDLALMICVDQDDEWPVALAPLIEDFIARDVGQVAKVGSLKRPDAIRSEIVKLLLHHVLQRAGTERDRIPNEVR